MRFKAGAFHFGVIMVSAFLVCGRAGAEDVPQQAPPSAASSGAPAASGQQGAVYGQVNDIPPADDAMADAPAGEQQVQLVGLGDSLMAGYQLQGDESLPSQLEKTLHEKGFNVAISNAGVSGDTTEGALARVDWSVPDGTDGVIVELGANDALRGIAPEQSERNLATIVEKLQARKIAVFLVGMIAPPNMGEDYSNRFNGIYKRLAEKYKVPLYPFVLDGVVTDPSLKIGDGMHPNAKGVNVMATRMSPMLESFIKALADNRN